MVVDQRHERVKHVVVSELQDALAELVIAAERLGPELGLANQVLDHAGRNRVAEQRRVEGGRVTPRARLEPVALHHAVVDRRVSIQAGRVSVVERLVREAAIGLRSAGRQQLAILAVADLRGLTGRQRNGREVRVRGRERGVRILRHAAKPLGQRQQFLAPFVQHVLLQPEHFFDCEAVDRELGRLVHPLADAGKRQLQQFRLEPRRGLLPFRDQQLHALAAGVDGVVALILVVLQRRVIPDLVTQLREGVAIAQGAEQLVRTLRQRALIFLVGFDAVVELCEGRFPRVPAAEDGTEIPRVFRVE